MKTFNSSFKYEFFFNLNSKGLYKFEYKEFTEDKKYGGAQEIFDIQELKLNSDELEAIHLKIKEALDYGISLNVNYLWNYRNALERIKTHLRELKPELFI